MNKFNFYDAYLSLAILLFAGGLVAAPKSNVYLWPTALAATGDGKTPFIACANTRQILYWDAASQKIAHTITLPQPATGLALSRDNTRLYVTCAAPESQVCVIDVARHKIIQTLLAGHTKSGQLMVLAYFVCGGRSPSPSAGASHGQSGLFSRGWS